MFHANALLSFALLIWLGKFSADFCGERNTTYHEPNFYERKLKTLFAVADANKDGFITKRDYDVITNRFIYIVHLCGYDAKILRYKEVPKVNLMPPALGRYR